jgi:hypothetical protein
MSAAVRRDRLPRLLVGWVVVCAPTAERRRLEAGRKMAGRERQIRPAGRAFPPEQNGACGAWGSA